MRVVLFTEGDFPQADANHIRVWIGVFSRHLRKSGLSVELFAPGETRIRTGDLVHVFGLGRPENWHWLRRLGGQVVVSPFPVAGEGRVAFSRSSRWFHRLRRLSRLGRAPFDQEFFARSVDAFYLFESPAALPRLPAPMHLLPPDASSAAERMVGYYASHR